MQELQSSLWKGQITIKMQFTNPNNESKDTTMIVLWFFTCSDDL